MVARQVFYSGRVQGVGFRFTAQRIARGYGVVGYVRNLPDGRVELWAQGPDAEVSRFLLEISDRMKENIAGIGSKPVEPDAGMVAFEIRR